MSHRNLTETQKEPQRPLLAAVGTAAPHRDSTETYRKPAETYKDTQRPLVAALGTAASHRDLRCPLVALLDTAAPHRNPIGTH